MEEIIEALELKKTLDNLRPIDKEQEDRIMQKFRLDWNYHSNHLEGNLLTYGETKALILFGVTAQGKTLKDHFEITGHNQAIDWVIDMIKGERPLTENFIRELHLLLLKESSEKPAITPDGKPTTKRINVGSYKTSPNHVETVTGEIFYFATPEETPAKMTELLNWYQEKASEDNVNPIFLASEFHYKFISIHPFDDGNGRTARILMNFILMKFGFPPVIIKTEDKSNYFIALQLADVGNIEAFINYIAQNLVRSLQIMIAGANGESIEEPDDLDKEIALLEQRLNVFGEKIKKVKSIDNINDIFSNSIKNLSFQLRDKLSKFDKHYLNKEIYIIANNKSISLDEENFHLDVFNDSEIRIYFNYNSIKTQGLENHSFSYEVKFKFEELKYSVYVGYNGFSLIYTKNYINLDEKEINNLVSIVIKEHNSYLNDILDKNN